MSKQPDVRERGELAVRAYYGMVDTAVQVGRRMGRHLGSFGLTVPEFRMLEMASHRDGVSPQAVARRLGYHAPNVTRLADVLEKRGLIRRQADRKDGRRVTVELTGEGRRLMAKVYPKHAKVIRAEMRALSIAEQRSLEKLCGKLRKGDAAKFLRELIWEDAE
jgi:MarR family transcriptional regulator, 2-MHQ and catechol-resistance regulon repressor